MRLQAFSTSRVAARDIAKMTLVGRIGGVDLREGKNGQQYLTYKVATTDKGRPPKDGGASPALAFCLAALRGRARTGLGVGDIARRPLPDVRALRGKV